MVYLQETSKAKHLFEALRTSGRRKKQSNSCTAIHPAQAMTLLLSFLDPLEAAFGLTFSLAKWQRFGPSHPEKGTRFFQDRRTGAFYIF